jgi:NADPH-dependent curcumin reductase CurA
MAVNKQWIYARKPAAEVGPENFDLLEAPMPEPSAGEALVRTTLLSLDPASRAWMHGATYRSQLNPGDVMAGWGLGEVVLSNAKGFEPGDLVSGEFGWQTHAAFPARALTKHDRAHRPEHILSVLGITGLTAYFGMLDVGRPRPVRQFWSPARQVLSARSPDRSRSSRVAASSGRLVAPRKANGSSMNSASMRPSTTRAAISTRR